MAGIFIKKINNDDVSRVVNEELHFSRLPESYRRQLSECSFQDELRDDLKRFNPLPPEERTYFLAEHNGYAEALIGIRYVQGDRANISSFGRVTRINRDSASAAGWQYLYEMCKLLCQKGIIFIYSHISSKGGMNAFEALKSKSEYIVHIFKNHYPRSAIIHKADSQGSCPNCLIRRK